MRQKADQTRHAQPLTFAGRDELVEQYLRAIGEVAELSLPHCKRVRLGERIAILEAEHGLFREQRIDDLVMSLIAAEVVEWRVAALVLLVDQNGMALREGATFGILSRQA